MTPHDNQHHCTGEGTGIDPPADLPISAEAFWARGLGVEPLNVPAVDEPMPALKRLGPPPFARGGFPMIGFLETVYEHIADHAREVNRSFRCRP